MGQGCSSGPISSSDFKALGCPAFSPHVHRGVRNKGDPRQHIRPGEPFKAIAFRTGFPIIFKIVTLVLFAFFQEGCTVLEKEGEDKKKEKNVSSFPESFKYFSVDRALRSWDQRARRAPGGGTPEVQSGTWSPPMLLTGRRRGNQIQQQGVWKDLGGQVPRNVIKASCSWNGSPCLSRQSWMINSVYLKAEAENGPSD